MKLRLSKLRLSKLRLSNLALVAATALVLVAIMRPLEPEAAADAPFVHPTMWAVLAAPDIDPKIAQRPGVPLERPRGANGQLSPEMIEACLAVAEDLSHDLARQLRELRDRDRTAFERRLQRSRRLISMAVLRERDPILYDKKLLEMSTDAEVSRLAAEVREARKNASAQIESLETELRFKVIIQFGLRHQARERYLAQILEFVDQMQCDLAFEREHFNEVLADRMEELLNDPES